MKIDYHIFKSTHQKVFSQIGFEMRIVQEQILDKLPPLLSELNTHDEN